MLGQSFDSMEIEVMQSTIEQEKEGMGCFEMVQFGNMKVR